MLTRLLIAVNVVVFVWEYATGDTSNGAVLVRDGALYGPAVSAGEWWRIITAAFLHAGILHIATNMFALYQVGTFVEVLFGRVRMAIIYAVAIAGSGFAVLHYNYSDPTVGASGAIFGLFGALAAGGLLLGKPGRQLVQQSAGIIALNLILGFTVFRFVSNSAHIGGLLAGAALGFVLFRRPVGFAPAPEPVAVDATTTYEAPEIVAHAGEPPPRPVAPSHDPQT